MLPNTKILPTDCTDIEKSGIMLDCSEWLSEILSGFLY